MNQSQQFRAKRYATAAVARADEARKNGIRLMLVAGVTALLISLVATASLAAGTETSSSNSNSNSNSSYTVSNPSKAMRQATRLINAEDYQQALVQLESEIAANPKNADAWNLTGFASRKLGDYGRSETAYDKALALDPTHTGALEYKGELYLTLGNLDGAQAMLGRLKDLCSFNCSEFKALNKAINLYKKSN